MNVLVKLSNGNTTSIPGIHWNPDLKCCLRTKNWNGCYVEMSSLIKYNGTYNKDHAKIFPEDHISRSSEDFISMIECAEMPFVIVDSIVKIKEVPYGMSDDFWTNHA